MAGDKQIDRKAFFKEGPLSFMRSFMQGMHQGETRIQRSTLEGPVLRPPGAAPEADFLDLCTGSAQCALACPADASLMLPREDGSGPRSAPHHPRGRSLRGL